MRKSYRKQIEDELLKINKVAKNKLYEYERKLEILQHAVCDKKHVAGPADTWTEKIKCRKCGKEMTSMGDDIQAKIFIENYYKEYGNQEDRELEEIIRPKSLKCICGRDEKETAELLYSDYYPTFIETKYRCKCGRNITARQFRKFPHPKTEKEQENEE